MITQSLLDPPTQARESAKSGALATSVGVDHFVLWSDAFPGQVVVLVDKRRLDPWLAAADTCLPYTMCGFAGSDVVGYTGGSPSHTSLHVCLATMLPCERSERQRSCCKLGLM